MKIKHKSWLTCGLVTAVLAAGFSTTVPARAQAFAQPEGSERPPEIAPSPVSGMPSPMPAAVAPLPPPGTVVTTTSTTSSTAHVLGTIRSNEVASPDAAVVPSPPLSA
ncbi:MAG: hypothetical protein M3N08_04620 [Pseudomonadota bacterium]|nr:hypothetical protein [Pseudomonadota bacterium]